MRKPTFPPMRYEVMSLRCLLFGHRFRWERVDYMWVQQRCPCGTTGETKMEIRPVE